MELIISGPEGGGGGGGAAAAATGGGGAAGAPGGGGGGGGGGAGVPLGCVSADSNELLLESLTAEDWDDSDAWLAIRSLKLPDEDPDMCQFCEMLNISRLH